MSLEQGPLFVQNGNVNTKHILCGSKNNLAMGLEADGTQDNDRFPRKDCSTHFKPKEAETKLSIRVRNNTAFPETAHALEQKATKEEIYAKTIEKSTIFGYTENHFRLGRAQEPLQSIQRLNICLQTPDQDRDSRTSASPQNPIRSPSSILISVLFLVLLEFY
ncbi:hypothetical protein DdX_14834 [Ditylenchus destructor]|uniref:Uncharacterized protein n=1 Tax=Ditylenchus destructor TaxID=166010 RepID=A0AAD4MWE2_9BILA|nr:hypothetical protein DdX_14834 [Ditylenchus destructor]